MTAFNEIREALETEIANVTGIPASSQRAWENAQFEPTPGTTWVRMTLQPTEQRPAVRGGSPQLRYQGLFLVDVFTEVDQGPSEADELADNIRAQYSVGTILTAGSTTVRFEYAERGQGTTDPPWYMVPVEIAWYSYQT
jgi:hypothetical protein